MTRTRRTTTTNRTTTMARRTRRKTRRNSQDPQEESSKVNDKCVVAENESKDKGKGRAKDDDEPQNSGTNKKNVHFSEKDNRKDDKKDDAEAEKPAETPDWPSEAAAEWGNTTGDDSATAANTGTSTWGANTESPAWNSGLTELADVQCKRSHFQTRDQNPNTRQGRNRPRTRSHSRARSRSYEENELNTRPLSLKPVLGRNGHYKYWACDSDGIFSLRTRAEIEEQCQLGRWEEDGGHEYFRSHSGS